MSQILTRLDALRADTNLDKNEVLLARNGSIRLFEKQTMDPNTIITDDLVQKAAVSQGRGLRAPVLDDATGTVTQETLKVAITGTLNTSKMVVLTFVNYYFGFLMHKEQHTNNSISEQREFNRQMDIHIRELQKQRNANARLALEANKNQVAPDLLGKYAFTGNEYLAPFANRDEIVGDLNVALDALDFDYSTLDVVANAGAQSHIRNRVLEKGEFNIEDKRYQWSDKAFFFDDTLANTGTNTATMIAVVPGSTGVVRQFAPDCISGNRSGAGHVWDIVDIPVIGSVGYYGYDGAVNGSGLSGAASAHLTATYVKAHSFHMAEAYMTVYNSDISDKANPILKAAIQAAS